MCSSFVIFAPFNILTVRLTISRGNQRQSSVKYGSGIVELFYQVGFNVAN